MAIRGADPALMHAAKWVVVVGASGASGILQGSENLMRHRVIVFVAMQL